MTEEVWKVVEDLEILILQEWSGLKCLLFFCVLILFF